MVFLLGVQNFVLTWCLNNLIHSVLAQINYCFSKTRLIFGFLKSEFGIINWDLGSAKWFINDFISKGTPARSWNYSFWLKTITSLLPRIEKMNFTVIFMSKMELRFQSNWRMNSSLCSWGMISCFPSLQRISTRIIFCIW